jgi:uncharacterized protein (TIGR00304 family)
MAFGLVLDLTTAGVLLVFLGFGIIAIATIFSSRSNSERGEVKGGGVVMIGPIPIIFGSDAKWTGIAVALALVLVLLSLWLIFRL